MVSLRFHALLLAAALPAAGCVKTPLAGIVATEGVVIKVDEGGYTLAANKEFEPPFNSGACLELPIATEQYTDAEDKGAQRVRVTYPGLEQPLFGLLMLCTVPSGATGPGTRRYRIEIPESYVKATEGGKYSVVYELVEDSNRDAANWVLFLSRTPFPQR